MHPAERKVLINGKSFELTRTEFELYQWMRLHRGSVVSRDALLKNVWGFPTEADTRSVDMCIRRLRVKIGSGVIRTIYGRGYILME
ncbi:MAG: winged helix-turn-helix transcriptional regulator [Clostridia bacterium]|nr:winged helix-turn-helix transcriptional regulator [Clostridia bacterium]